MLSKAWAWMRYLARRPGPGRFFVALQAGGGGYAGSMGLFFFSYPVTFVLYFSPLQKLALWQTRLASWPS